MLLKALVLSVIYSLSISAADTRDEKIYDIQLSLKKLGLDWKEQRVAISSLTFNTNSRSALTLKQKQLNRSFNTWSNWRMDYQSKWFNAYNYKIPLVHKICSDSPQYAPDLAFQMSKVVLSSQRISLLALNSSGVSSSSSKKKGYSQVNLVNSFFKEIASLDDSWRVYRNSVRGFDDSGKVLNVISSICTNTSSEAPASWLNWCYHFDQAGEGIHLYNSLTEGSRINANDQLSKTVDLLRTLDRKFLLDLIVQVRATHKIVTSNPPGISGCILAVLESKNGTLIIGGAGPNRYEDCNASIIIDVGGNDQYIKNNFNTNTVSIIVDQAGDDVYQSASCALGFAYFGTSVIWDWTGDDTYISSGDGGDSEFSYAPGAWLGNSSIRKALRSKLVMPNSGFSFGSSWNGVSVLQDDDGSDVYIGDKWSFGAAWGSGSSMLVDFSGDDFYFGGVGCFGVGINGGVGVAIDLGVNNDVYDLFPKYKLSKCGERGNEFDSFESFGMGVGAAWRWEIYDESNHSKAPGIPGVGFCFNEGGNDEYNCQSFSMGVGFAGGLGVFVDGSGNDRYEAMLSENPKIAPIFCFGVGCHRGVGVFMELAGNDSYKYSRKSGGFGWDMGCGFLLDFQGQDAIKRSKVGRPVDDGLAGAQGLGVYGSASISAQDWTAIGFPPPSGGDCYYYGNGGTYSIGLDFSYLSRTNNLTTDSQNAIRVLREEYSQHSCFDRDLLGAFVLFGK